MIYYEQCYKLGFDKCLCKDKNVPDYIEGEYYSINRNKLVEICDEVSRLTGQNITSYEVEDDLINTDWEEGDEHQEWLDNEPIKDIARSVVSLYPDW